MKEKQPEKDTRTPFQMERQNNARAALRLLLSLYLAYVIYQLIKGYVTGDSGMSLPLFAAAILFFTAAEAAILVFSLKRWNQGRKRVDQAWEDQADAPGDPDSMPAQTEDEP